MSPPPIQIAHPGWLTLDGREFATDGDKIRLAIDLARDNVLHETGGPFGAAIFPADGRRPVAVGTNGVPRLHNSVAHAEPIATMAAEAFLDNEVFTATKAPRSSTSTSSTAGRSTTDRLTAWTSS